MICSLLPSVLDQSVSKRLVTALLAALRANGKKTFSNNFLFHSNNVSRRCLRCTFFHESYGQLHPRVLWETWFSGEHSGCRWKNYYDSYFLIANLCVLFNCEGIMRYKHFVINKYIFYS